MSLIPESELSGFARLLGYRLARWEPDRAEVVLELGSQHQNRGHVAHGGVLATLIDTACGFAGCWAPEGQTRAAVTLSLTTQFLAPAASGQPDRPPAQRLRRPAPGVPGMWPASRCKRFHR